MELHLERYKEKQLEALLIANDSKTERLQKLQKGIALSVVLGSWLVLIKNIMFKDGEFLPDRITDGEIWVPMLFIIIIVFIIWLTVSSRTQRTRDKTLFALQVFEGLRDELFPLKKVQVAMDLTLYNKKHKEYWTGRSSHGNAKYKYNDAWFLFKMMFVDRTLVSFKYRNKVKTKKGSVVKDKRQLKITILPDSRFYTCNGAELAPRIEQNLRWEFAQMFTQGFVCQCRPLQNNAGFTIKISQSSLNYETKHIKLLFWHVYSVLKLNQKRR